jgi:hypothetical protein
MAIMRGGEVLGLSSLCGEQADTTALIKALRNSSGSLAKFAAIRRAS